MTESNMDLLLRVDPEVRDKAQRVLDRLGISMSAAVNLYLNQIVMNDGIPFDVRVIQPAADVHVKTSEDSLQAKVRQGYDDYNAGRMQDDNEERR